MSDFYHMNTQMNHLYFPWNDSSEVVMELFNALFFLLGYLKGAVFALTGWKWKTPAQPSLPCDRSFQIGFTVGLGLQWKRYPFFSRYFYIIHPIRLTVLVLVFFLVRALF